MMRKMTVENMSETQIFTFLANTKKIRERFLKRALDDEDSNDIFTLRYENRKLSMALNSKYHILRSETVDLSTDLFLKTFSKDAFLSLEEDATL